MSIYHHILLSLAFLMTPKPLYFDNKWLSHSALKFENIVENFHSRLENAKSASRHFIGFVFADSLPVLNTQKIIIIHRFISK